MAEDNIAVVLCQRGMAEPVWERCTGTCGREYAYPHLCRKHMLCGICHQEVPHGVPF